VGYWAARKGRGGDGRGLGVRRGRGVHSDARVVLAAVWEGRIRQAGPIDQRERANGQPTLTRRARATERAGCVRERNQCRQVGPTR
jgi:hypothetical protein